MLVATRFVTDENVNNEWAFCEQCTHTKVDTKAGPEYWLRSANTYNCRRHFSTGRQYSRTFDDSADCLSNLTKIISEKTAM